jgi:hypothetical protein
MFAAAAADDEKFHGLLSFSRRFGDEGAKRGEPRPPWLPFWQ